MKGLNNKKGLFYYLLIVILIILNNEIKQVSCQYYAIGAINTQYKNYAIYTFPQNDLINFINTYNQLGGFPSLGTGSTPPSNCIFNVYFDNVQQSTCSCPFVTPANEIASLLNPFNSLYCLSTAPLTTSSIITSNPDGFISYLIKILFIIYFI